VNVLETIRTYDALCFMPMSAFIGFNVVTVVSLCLKQSKVSRGSCVVRTTWANLNHQTRPKLPSLCSEWVLLATSVLMLRHVCLRGPGARHVCVLTDHLGQMMGNELSVISAHSFIRQYILLMVSKEREVRVVRCTACFNSDSLKLGLGAFA